MKIAISGSGTGTDPTILQKSKQLGREIAKNKHILLTGGCKGYPYAVLRGTLLENGKIIVYSPAKDEQEHTEKYNFPIDPEVEYEFTGLGIPERNLPLVYNSDAVIFIEGKIGTLNEFTIAFHENKPIGILKTGPLTELMPRIAEICNKSNEKDKIIVSEDPKELVKLLLRF